MINFYNRASEVVLNHIFLIDPLEKLVIKKDSSLLMAHTAQQQGVDAYVMFLEDLYFDNRGQHSLKVYPFQSSLKEGSYYLDVFSLHAPKKVTLQQGDVLHMRLDPPFDLRYLHSLWLLSALRDQGVEVVNNPRGILEYNEKLVAYTHSDEISSWVGNSEEESLAFLQQLQKSSIDAIIVKPLDLFQGIGVEKFLIKDKSSEDLKKIIHKKRDEFSGPIVMQPFIKEVAQGEIRSIFYKGEELGTILKVPQKGEFLANIAQGAKFHQIDLSKQIENNCKKIANRLEQSGVDLIAFDILGGVISEVNITCPGLLVEVSEACGKNLAIPLFS